MENALLFIYLPNHEIILKLTRWSHDFMSMKTFRPSFIHSDIASSNRAIFSPLYLSLKQNHLTVSFNQ